MNGVAAPLYRFFLTDAQAAARSGETERMLECLGLALDFAPETQRERVLLAAAELAPPADLSGPATGAEAARPPAVQFVVEIGDDVGVDGRLGRIRWEDHVTHAAAAARHPTSTEAPAKTTRSFARWRSRRLFHSVLTGATLAALVSAAVQLGWIPVEAGVVAVQSDPMLPAARALQRGDAGRALWVLEPLGAEAPAEAWLLRASAYETLGDTSAAVQALVQAAARDADGGRWALKAGDRLERLGALAHAADAYLYAVTPVRTTEELERIARIQELAGYRDRALRVRQH